jgi:hypothetical protein
MNLSKLNLDMVNYSYSESAVRICQRSQNIYIKVQMLHLQLHTKMSSGTHSRFGLMRVLAPWEHHSVFRISCSRVIIIIIKVLFLFFCMPIKCVQSVQVIGSILKFLFAAEVFSPGSPARGHFENNPIWLLGKNNCPRDSCQKRVLQVMIIQTCWAGSITPSLPSGPYQVILACGQLVTRAYLLRYRFCTAEYKPSARIHYLYGGHRPIIGVGRSLYESRKLKMQCGGLLIFWTIQRISMIFNVVEVILHLM